MHEYTVKELGKIAGVSVRTLHHYDEIGILKPVRVGENGYRYYDQDDLVKLMRILLYKELDFSLSEIYDLVNDGQENQIVALKKQKDLLNLKRKQIKDKIKTIDLIINSLNSEKDIDTEKLAKTFGNEEIDQYKEEAKARWGHADAYRQSVERSNNWTKEDIKKIKTEGESITLAIAKLMDKNASDPKVQKQIAKHHKHIDRFYDCSYEMYRGLGQMYFNDPRFSEYYDKIKPGSSKFMKEAIDYYYQSKKRSGVKA